MIWLVAVVVMGLGTLAAWALCAHAGHLDDEAGRDIPWIPYHCTQVYCPAEFPSLAAVDQHLRVHHGIAGGAR